MVGAAPGPSESTAFAFTDQAGMQTALRQSCKSPGVTVMWNVVLPIATWPQGKRACAGGGDEGLP
eukprot:5815539-Alexandrium_andersonii.AAC.1